MWVSVQSFFIVGALRTQGAIWALLSQQLRSFIRHSPLSYLLDRSGLREGSYLSSFGHKASVSESVLGVSSNGMSKPSISWRVLPAIP